MKAIYVNYVSFSGNRQDEEIAIFTNEEKANAFLKKLRDDSSQEGQDFYIGEYHNHFVPIDPVELVDIGIV